MLACRRCGRDVRRCGHRQLRNGARGVKHDAGKLDWLLFPFDGAEAIVRVLEFGARKYAPDNWRRLAPRAAYDRFRRSALRHLAADARGEELDPESGEPHLAHAACQILFALATRRKW